MWFNKINMYWYKMPSKQENYGDVLGPYIVHKLTGKQIRFVPTIGVRIKPIIERIIGVFKGTNGIFDTLKFLISAIYNINRKNIIVSVGSIISVFNRRSIKVWGAGLMNRNDNIQKASFYAVRGKYSQKRLEELGYKSPEVIGDPALLLPLLIDPASKRYQLGIIPHFVHYEEVKNANISEEILVINLLNDIDTVTENITSCRYTVSSSLHGLIVSHAYNIASLWVNFSDDKIVGDNIKFKDYFSSVAISFYAPFQINLEQINVDKILDQINSNSSITVIQNDLKIIQRDLIKVAPFQVLENFKPK